MTEENKKVVAVTSTDLEAAGRIEFLFKVISRLDFYINSTNTKASLVVAWNGIVIGTILVKYEDILKGLSRLTCGEQIAAVTLFCIGMAGVVSIFLVLSVIYPYLRETSEKDAPGRSLLYFGAISAMKTDRYYQKVGSVTNDDLIADLSGQAVTLSDGLMVKIKKVQWAVRIIFAQLVLMGCLVILEMAAHVDFLAIGCFGGGK